MKVERQWFQVKAQKPSTYSQDRVVSQVKHNKSCYALQTATQAIRHSTGDHLHVPNNLPLVSTSAPAEIQQPKFRSFCQVVVSVIQFQPSKKRSCPKSENVYQMLCSIQILCSENIQVHESSKLQRRYITETELKWKEKTEQTDSPTPNPFRYHTQ